MFPQAPTPTQTPSPKKSVGFSFDATPSTDGESTASPEPPPHTPSPTELPRPGLVKASPVSDEDETSMDIADDNLTLPLPSALIKRQLQPGIRFLVDDCDSEEEEMDVTQPLGGIIPPRDGVNRFLNEDDQTMEFIRACSSNKAKSDDEDSTVGMEFTRVVGKIQGLNIPAVDKENRPPVSEDDEDGTHPLDVD